MHRHTAALPCLPTTEEAWRTAPTVLESGLDALEDFDAWGLPRRSGSSTSATATPAAAKAHEGKQDGGAAVAGAEREAGGKGQEEQKEEGEGEGDGRAKKRQKTMADVVVRVCVCVLCAQKSMRGALHRHRLTWALACDSLGPPTHPRTQQLHRKLSDLQKTRTELRWLVEQVERLEYEAL